MSTWGWVLGSTALLGLASCSHAAPLFRRADGERLTRAQVDATVARLMEAGRVPGLALGLVEDGRVVLAVGYGVRDVATGRPLTPDTVMAGASLTKPAFAYLCMTLVDEGRLELDRPIRELLPKPLPAYPGYVDLAGDPRWERITPRMLLSHTSGLPNWRWLDDDPRLDIELEPGARYSYSGEGIKLLQFVLEEGLGLDVAALMQQRVFDRFGMRRTAMTWRADFEEDHATGYDEAGKSLGHDRRDSVDAAGSMDTTVADFARFLAGFTRGEGLSARALDEMLRTQVDIHSVTQFPTPRPETTQAYRPIALGYGLGWGLFRSPFGPAFFKEGHEDGWNNYALCLRPQRRCVLVLANSANGESIFKYLVDALLGDTQLPWAWEGYVPYDQRNPLR